MGTKIPDSVFTSEDGQEQIVDIVTAMVGFVSGNPQTMAFAFYLVLIAI